MTHRKTGHRRARRQVFHAESSVILLPHSCLRFGGYYTTCVAMPMAFSEVLVRVKIL